MLTGILLINSLIVIGIIIFATCFENFYIKNIGRELNYFGEYIDVKVEKGINEDVENDILNQSKTKGFTVDIYDKSNNLVFSTKPMGNGMGNHKNNMGKSMGMCTFGKEYEISSNSKVYTMYERTENIEFLSAINKNNDYGYSIITKTPISTIKNSVNIALKFLIIIFVPIMLFSIIIAVYFSNKFTKPIRKLNKITDKISKLNFEEKVEVFTGDEIENLGNSINKLSYEIKKAFTNLSDKNIKLNELLDKQKKEEKLKREFVSSVSHELKTPITVINGYAEGLRNNIAEREEDREFYVNVICDESEKMGVLVKDLLDLYKLESKSFSLKKEKFYLNNLIEEVINIFSIRLRNERINISLNLENIWLIGDKIRIGQVLNNFIDNAICHVDGNKEIIIGTKIYEDKNKVKISVYNSGEKIEECKKESIWYSFIRESEHRGSEDNRVGLGLAIVREIINLHDGQYGVENKEHRVEFWVELNIYNFIT